MADTAPSTPLVSVVMPVYNGERFLSRAVRNVLDNGYPALQVLVVDDGSTDDTARLARRLPPPVEVIEQPNAGPAAARNAALRRARGKYVTFLDVDDRWPAGRLRAHTALLERQPTVGIVQGLIRKVRLLDADVERPIERPLLRPYRFINLGSATMRRALFDIVGPFDESLRFNEDTDWFFRAWELGVEKHVSSEVALCYRVHDGNMTREFHREPGQGIPRLFKRHLMRRRQGKVTAPPAGFCSLVEYIGWDDIAAAQAEQAEGPE